MSEWPFLRRILCIDFSCIVHIMTGVSGGSIDTAYHSLPLNYPSSATIAHIPPPPTIPLHASIRALMSSIENISRAPFPFLAARLQLISPTWRKHYAYLSTFFDDKIAEAEGKKDEDIELATDADCVVDMAVRRQEREGMGQTGKVELVDELMTYVVQVSQSLFPQPLDLELRDCMFQRRPRYNGSDACMVRQVYRQGPRYPASAPRRSMCCLWAG